MMLGRRGYDVALAEAGTELGGRVAPERKLPGLSAWGRVADYRTGQLAQMANVEIYLRQPARRRRRAGASAFGTSRSRPASPGGATAWRGSMLSPMPIAAGCGCADAGRPHGRASMPSGQSGASSTTTTTITWAACSPSCWRVKASR